MPRWLPTALTRIRALAAECRVHFTLKARLYLKLLLRGDCIVVSFHEDEEEDEDETAKTSSISGSNQLEITACDLKTVTICIHNGFIQLEVPAARESVALIRYIIYDISKEGEPIMADDLEQHIKERERRSPGFAALVKAAVQRRAFARKMAARRKKIGLSQTQVAARMETSASIVGRVESGADVRLSTLEKYVTALGFELELKAKRAAKAQPTTRRKAKAG